MAKPKPAANTVVTVAVVQAASVAFDRKRTLEKALDLTRDAARQGAKLVLFPEAFISGYPRGSSFGATVGELPARMTVMHDTGKLLPHDKAVERATTQDERRQIQQLLGRGHVIGHAGNLSSAATSSDSAADTCSRAG